MTTPAPIQQTFDFDLPAKLNPGEVVLNCSVCGTPYIFHSFKNVAEGEEFGV